MTYPYDQGTQWAPQQSSALSPSLTIVAYQGSHLRHKLRSTYIARVSVLIIVAIAAALFWTGIQAATDIDRMPVRGEWVRTSDSPLSARNDATIAWNGTEVLVFGGTQFLCHPLSTSFCTAPSNPPFTDGAAYNPSTDTWREIADAPVGIRWSVTATVGADLFVLASTSYTQRSLRLLRYQSTLDNWAEFNLPEDTVSAGIIAFGNDVLLYTTSDEFGPSTDWQLNTTTGQWAQIPDDPLGPGFNRQFITHDDDLYLFDHALVPSPGGASGPSYLRAARFRRQQWSVLPTADSIGSAPTLVAGSQLFSPKLGCADGGGTNGYGRCIAYGAVFDTTTDSWYELPSAPGRGTKYVSSSGGLGDNELVLFQPGYPALDAVTSEWFIFPQLDTDRNIQRKIQAAGPYGFAFGGAIYRINAVKELLKEAWIWKR